MRRLRSLPPRLRTLYGGLILGTLLTLLMLLFLQNLSLFSRAELSAYDFQFQRRGPLPTPSNIVIVGVDTASLQDLDNFSIPPHRSRVADALNFLCQKAHVKAIGIDFEYTNNSHYGPADDAALARALKRCGNVAIVSVINNVSASNFIQAEVSVTPPIPSLARAAARIGVANVPLDPDGIIRHSVLIQNGPNNTQIPNLALQVASIALHKPALAIARHLPDDTLLNYIGPQDPGNAALQTWRTTEFESVALGQDDPSIYRNKIVMIIPDAIQFGDVHGTPYGEMDGGYIQANTLNTILQQYPIKPAGGGVNNIILLLIGLVTTAIASRFGIWHSAAAVLGLAIGYPIATIIAFTGYRFWLNLATPELTLILVFAGIMAFRFATEERQKRRAHQKFGQYVKPEIVDIIVNSPDEDSTLEGVRRPISVLFADIRGFTSTSEHMQPEDVVRLLDIYLEELTDSVQAFDGTLDKYVGDEIMALWNAPRLQVDHPMLAVKSALEMVNRLEKINARLSEIGLPMIRFGIGVNTGEAIVGEMGSSFRKQYDTIGDAVNTGARLCSAAGGGEIIIGQRTWELIGNQLELEETEPLRLKGKSEPLRTFKVLGLSAAPTPTLTAATTPA